MRSAFIPLTPNIFHAHAILYTPGTTPPSIRPTLSSDLRSARRLSARVCACLYVDEQHGI